MKTVEIKNEIVHNGVALLYYRFVYKVDLWPLWSGMAG